MVTMMSPTTSPKQYQSSNSNAQPTNVYTAGLPAPPRILIPPPTIHSEGRSFDTSAALNPSYSGSHPLPEMMHNIGDSAFLPQSSLQDWKYESRREAQQILPHLWLGPLSAAKNIQFLTGHNITQLLAVRSSMTARARLLTGKLPGIRYESIDVPGNQELIGQFQRATEIIDQHFVTRLPPAASAGMSVPLSGRELGLFLKRYAAEHPGEVVRGGVTLLFCESGNERSAAVAAAYVMQYIGGNAVQAIQVVQSRRFCVCFDDSMKWLLTSYEPIWMARRQAAWQNRLAYGGHGAQNGGASDGGSGGGSTFRGSNKRRLEEDEGEEEDTQKGTSHAPFSDKDAESHDMEMT